MDGDVLGTLAKSAGFENLDVAEAMKLFRFGQMVADAAEKAERGLLASAIKDKADEWDDRAEAYGMLLAVDVITEASPIHLACTDGLGGTCNFCGRTPL